MSGVHSYIMRKNNLAGTVFLQGEKSDEAINFIGFFLVRCLTYTDIYGTYSNANSTFLRLSSMACRLPL